MSIEKPSELYHGSPHSDIEVFKPRVSLGSGEKYGELVYASQDIAISSIFLAKVEGKWSSGRFGNVPYALIPMSREEFIKNDTGGYIYVLPSETFESDASRGMGEKEWASPVEVKPVKKIFYPSALDAMINNGVQVYFLNDQQYLQTRTAKDKGQSYLKTINSENQLRNKNVFSF